MLQLSVAVKLGGVITEKNRNILDFKACIDDLLSNPDVQSMRNIRQHININCLDHCLFVSYVSYRICRFWGLDFVAAARGGLLHDMFLYDQYKKGSHQGNHLRTHPKSALENASKVCVLSDVEKDIILKHMWPLTFKKPKYKESLVVNLADTVCALAEMLFIYRWMDVKEKLGPVFLPA